MISRADISSKEQASFVHNKQNQCVRFSKLFYTILGSSSFTLRSYLTIDCIIIQLLT